MTDTERTIICVCGYFVLRISLDGFPGVKFVFAQRTVAM